MKISGIPKTEEEFDYDIQETKGAQIHFLV
jgi:hypothetical protein